jgi:hypothetical protein
MINGKGWALIIRADGTKSTWNFDAALWNDTTTLNANGHTTGTGDTTTEYKSPLFSVYPFSELRLGMRINGTTNWLEVKHAQYSSMRAVMSGGTVTFSGTTRNDWLALANNGALQPNCASIGINLRKSTATFRLRIGMTADDVNSHCNNPDSFVGFGSFEGFFSMNAFSL